MENNRSSENKRLLSLKDKSVDTATILGSGTVTAVLGKGGFATVYEIWNPKLEIKRAVKLWHPDISQKSLERFETEIKITAKLHHPNIVEIHNVGEWNGLPYIEMEKINGYCLKDIISQTGALPTEVAAAISILICRALTYAHRQNYILYGINRKGIVHCDIKPANIMITRRGVVKLTDFGLATPTDETLHLEADKVNGSIHYSSPEQLQSIQVDQRTDIYSLGVVMYEMYSGLKAFSAKNLEELISKRLQDDYTPFHEICRETNPGIKKVVKKCMAYERDDRYTSAQEVLVDIEKIFYKLTKETPERTISHFFSNTNGYHSANKNKAKISIITTASLILAAALFITFYYLGKKISNQVSNPYSITSNNRKSENQIATSNTKHPNNSYKKKSGTLTTPGTKKITNTNTKVEKEKNSTEARDIVDTKVSPELLDDVSVLQQLSTAIQKNDYQKAEQLFKSHPVTDGEYYFLYSQYLNAKGKWQDGLLSVDKGYRSSSRRLTPEQHRALYLSSKAKCLTAGFNQSGSKEQGQKAMEAWYDVKYLLKSTPNNPQYEFADSEIRRINKVLQNGSSN